MYTRSNYEDIEEQSLEKEALQGRRQIRCRKLGSIIFWFTVHDAHVEAICTVFYEQRDLLLIAKIRFGKSLIFQLDPFLSFRSDVFLTLMLLKLL